MYSKQEGAMLAIRLPQDIENRLDALAKATGRTKTYYAREAILTHLEDLEDAYEAEAAYLRFKASGEKALSLEEVMREYDLED
jgi:RHH-type rel operon transcriptional repressor/antitoxin RelB